MFTSNFFFRLVVSPPVVEGVEDRSGGVDVAEVEGVSALGVPVATLVLGVVAVGVDT